MPGCLSCLLKWEEKPSAHLLPTLARFTEWGRLAIVAFYSLLRPWVEGLLGNNSRPGAMNLSVWGNALPVSPLLIGLNSVLPEQAGWSSEIGLLANQLLTKGGGIVPDRIRTGVKIDHLCISGRNIKNLYNYFGESFDNTEDATPYIIVIPVRRFYPFFLWWGESFWCGQENLLDKF